MDPKAAQVTYPGFRLLADGASQISVDVSRVVPVTVHREASQVVYHMAGTQVALRTNTFPLRTFHFASPVVEAQLRRDPGGASLVVAIETESADGKPWPHRIERSPEGGMRLVVRVPALSARTSPLSSLAPSTATPPRPRVYGCAVPTRRRPEL